VRYREVVRTYRLESTTWVPRPIGEVFAFHADAGNLQALTPPFLDFTILTPGPIEMRPGALIRYRLRLYGIPMRWLTEISAWEPPRRFVDTQLKGPYRRWVHEHTFVEQDGGTEIRDRVTYAVPFGSLSHGWAVAPNLRRIFRFRHQALLKMFGGNLEAQPASIRLSRQPAE
jgi:ligand-binding SRPBCC domain-containing protein